MMTKRIFRSMFLLAAVILTACLILIMGVLYQYFSSRHNSEIVSETHYIAAAVETQGMNYFNTLTTSSNRITWIDADGTVLYDSAVTAQDLENHATREEIQKALNSGKGESTRYSSTLSQKTYNYALRLKDGTILRVSGTYYSIFTLFLGIAQPIAIVIIISLLLSALLAYRLSKIVVKPINELDLEHPDKAKAYEELAPLLHKIAKQNQTIRDQMVDLRRQQQEFKTIAENMSEGLLVVDRNTEVLSYNTAALQLLDVHPAEDNQSVLTFNRSEHFRKAVHEALAGRHSQQLMPVSDRIYQLIANPVKEKNETVGAVLAILDVTEREERDRLRQEFSANVSHELKTPLTSISGFAEIMMNGVVKPEDMQRFAGNIYEEAQRLISLIGDIIQLSRLDEKDMSDNIQPLDLFALARQVTERFRLDADKRNVSLQLQGEPCIINGVPQIIEEMVSNLCDNAVKYNHNGGSVTVAVTHREEDVLLAVTDTGVGIPYEDQERVFERFFRGDKSHSRQISGTGLGLSIVKHGALFHHAKLSLESRPGEGTSITLSFPLPNKSAI